MIKIKEAVVVEGRYDKSRLSGIVDTLIIATDGFRIFKDKEKLDFLRQTARERGLVILTDADRAGFIIRNYVKQGIDKSNIKHAYIPQISGKEPRKQKKGAEGLLGVEGISDKIIKNALVNAGVSVVSEENKKAPIGAITKADLFSLGLFGSADSAKNRRLLLKKLNLPQRINTNMLLDILNLNMTKDKLKDIFKSLL